MSEETILKVNDKIVPLNDMMESMLKNLILGYLNAAKGLPDDIKKINIEIKL